MFVIGGNEPQAEFTAEAMKRCQEWQAQKTAGGSSNAFYQVRLAWSQK